MRTHENSYLYNPLIGNFLSWFVALVIMSFYVNGVVDNPDMMLFGILAGCIWTIRLHAYREAERIEIRNIEIDHINRFIIRAAIMLIVGQIIHFMANGRNHLDMHFTQQSFKEGVFCAIYMAGIFWLEFDFILNSDRGKPLFYISKWYGTSKMDRLFSKFNSPILWLVSKILIFLLTLYLYKHSFE